MTINRLTEILGNIRGLLFAWVNKEFLIFLFFLILSALYWMLSVLNEPMEKEISVSVKITGVPRNVILLGDTVSDIRVVVRDKGYTVATYVYGDKLSQLRFPFSTHVKPNDRIVVTTTDIQRQLQATLFSSTKIVSIKPDKIECFYNFGIHKKVPVKLAGKVRPAETYYLTNVQFQPESVFVYAPLSKIDSIKEVYTQKVNISNVTDTIKRKISLNPIRGTKFLPGKVNMTVCTDVLTEGSVSVPVKAINVPHGKTFRMFPSKVNIQYVVGASQYNKIRPEQFSVVADYNGTAEGTSDKCTLRIVSFPKHVRNPRLEHNQLDYLIESK